MNTITQHAPQIILIVCLYAVVITCAARICGFNRLDDDPTQESKE